MSLFDRTPENCSMFDALSKSAAKVAIHNFRWQYATLILFNPAVVCGVDIFIKYYNKSFLIGQSTFNPWFLENTKQFVLFLNDLTDLSSLLKWLKSQRFNNTGKYLIVCNTIAEGTCNESQAVDLFWEYRISNVILIKYDGLRNPSGYTYFQDASCFNSPPVKLSHWETCTQIDNSEGCKQMFPLKFKNFNQCPLIVSTFEQLPFMHLKNNNPTGSDGELLLIIMKALNASLIIVTPNLGDGWGKLEENGTWSGSLGDVYYDLANFSMTSASITLHRFRYFQMSKDYNTVTIVWVTHPSNVEPSLFKLLRPYSTDAKIGLCFIFAFIVMGSFFFKSKYWQSLKVKLNLIDAPDSIIFYAWEICMGLPATRLPNKRILLYLTFFWILYCYLLRTLYQVYLINSIQTDVRIDSILKVEDAIDAGYPIGGGLALKDYFIDYPLVYNRYKNIESNDIYPTMLKLSKGLKFVIAFNLETTKIFLRKPRRKLHVLPQPILKSPTVIFFKKYSWLAQSIDNILIRLIESGLVQKIYKDNTFIRIDEDKDAPKSITLEDYAGCFMILVGGWIVSSLILVSEKYLHYKRQDKKCFIDITNRMPNRHK